VAAWTTSEQEEREIAVTDAAQVDSQLPLIHDSVIVQYINTLGVSMASRTSRADLRLAVRRRQLTGQGAAAATAARLW
jgi:predicted Zn-dependent protease